MKRRPMLGSRRQTRPDEVRWPSPLRATTNRQPGSGLCRAPGDPRRPHRGPTAGLAPGYVQGNLAILPQALAADFMRFCQLNPKPCPLIGDLGAGRSARA